MAAGSVNGLGVAAVAAGALLLWSGIKGASVTTSLRDLIGGKSPAGTQAYPLTAATGGGAGSGGSAAAGNTGAGSASAAKNQAIGRMLATPYGWSTGQQWADLVSLWNQESGWNNTAQNPSSGAYGIPQSLPASKMGAAANPPMSSATAQIAWGLQYIRDRYGSPSAAWAHETQFGWY